MLEFLQEGQRQIGEQNPGQRGIPSRYKTGIKTRQGTSFEQRWKERTFTCDSRAGIGESGPMTKPRRVHPSDGCRLVP